MSAPARVVLSTPFFLATPGAPTITPTGTDNSVTRAYKVVALDALGGHTAASSAGTDAHGATVQSGSNFETVTWTDVAGATSYDIYRTTGAVTGKIGNVLQGVQTFDDTGLVGDGTTAPTTNTTGVGTQTSLPPNSGAAAWVTGTFVGTLQVQATPDGVNWVNAGSALTAPGFVTLPVATAVRIKETAYTSGTPVATLLFIRQ